MNRTLRASLVATAGLLGLLAIGCEAGGVGDPCIPEDEYRQDFNGYAVSEVNIESKSFQCETRVCLVNHFRGRVSCPYGQQDADIAGSPPDAPNRCRIPGTDGLTEAYPGDPSSNIDTIRVPVDAQIKERAAANTVYCSCRCSGPDPNARYCECPSGFECKDDLVREIGLGSNAQLAGGYCIKAGTEFVPGLGDASFCRLDVPEDASVCGGDRNP